MKIINPIEIKDSRYDTNSNDTIYIVKDLDSTIFEFYDYKFADSFERKQKNYQLTLKKVNSNFVYKYDFDRVDSYMMISILIN